MLHRQKYTCKCKSTCYMCKSTCYMCKSSLENGQVHATCAKVHLQMDEYMLHTQKYTMQMDKYMLHTQKYMCKWKSTCANGQVHLSKQTIPQIFILNDVASKIEIFNVLETKKDRQHVPIF